VRTRAGSTGRGYIRGVCGRKAVRPARAPSEIEPNITTATHGQSRLCRSPNLKRMSIISPRLNTAPWIAKGLLFAAATLLQAGPSAVADDKPARPDGGDGAGTKKVDARKGTAGKGGDLAERVEALERQNKELAALTTRQSSDARKPIGPRGGGRGDPEEG
jgi:hypothetical protein